MIAAAIGFPIQTVSAIQQHFIRPWRAGLLLGRAIENVNELGASRTIRIGNDYDWMLPYRSRKLEISDIPLGPTHCGKSSGTSHEQPFWITNSSSLRAAV